MMNDTENHGNGGRDAFEDRLRELSLSGPTAALDRRVAEALDQAATPGRARAVRRGIPFFWAVAAALAMGLIGFAGGWLGFGPGGGHGRAGVGAPGVAGAPAAAVTNPSATPPPVTIQIIYTGDKGRNPFDFTRAADDGLRPETIKSEVKEGKT